MIDADDDDSPTYPIGIEQYETSEESEPGEWEIRSSYLSGDDFPGVVEEDNDVAETDEVLDEAITQLFSDNTP